MNNFSNKNPITIIGFLVFLIFQKRISRIQISNVSKTKVAAGCSPSTSQTDLDVNNVRTTIMAGGDMWWNLS